MTAASAHALRQPTIMCPSICIVSVHKSEVNLEKSIASMEESIGFQIKASVFLKFGNQSSEVQSDVRVTRGRVDNENNSQS